jgi:glycosyltransferase involved in cell wall biosynthesis
MAGAVVIRANSIVQTALTKLSAWLSKVGYGIYRVGLRSEALPLVLGRPLKIVCRLGVRFVQKACEAVLVLLIHPEMGYNPIKQRLIDKKREIAGRLTGVPERELTRAVRDLIERNNTNATTAGPAIVTTDGHAGQGFGVVIPFYRHLGFLEDCLRSVGKAAESLKNSELSVVIVNDDPEIGDALLESRIPAELKSVTQVLSNKRNIGISRTLNRGIMASHQPWLLLLDCDDKLHPTCFQVLSQAIRNNPDASLLSSQMMLINDRDQFLGYHFRYRNVSDHADDLAASHLKVFRRDLFEEIGYHNPQYDGCQDYELALRTAIQKRIDLIPDFLYVYRWHTNNQGISASARQNVQRKKISQAYRLVVAALTSGESPVRIDGDGHFRDSWLERLPRPTTSTSVSVMLPFSSDWALPRMIYLLADVLGVVYSRSIECNQAPLRISLPADYLDRLCQTAYDFIGVG